MFYLSCCSFICFLICIILVFKCVLIIFNIINLRISFLQLLSFFQIPVGHKLGHLGNSFYLDF